MAALQARAIATAVWVAPAEHLVARRDGDRVLLEDTLALTQGVLTGQCADDFADVAGGAGGPARARLVALARLATGLSQAALAAAAAGSFRPAGVTDLLRRDGWGQLWIELTAQCNERCVHCYAESSPERTEALDRATVLGVLDEAAAMGFAMVQFTGGDPLLCPFLAEAAAHARGLGLVVEVYTNGLALAPALLERLHAQQAAFAFSLYADRPAEHDAVTRTPGSHARTADAIRRAVAIGAPVRVAVIAMGENQARVAEAIAFARSLGVAPDRVGADVQHAVGRGTFDPALDCPDGAERATHRTRGLPAGEGQPSAAPRGRPGGSGRLCVGPGGQVWPCIFSRWIGLGRLGPGRGLAAVLADARPQPGWWRPSILDTGCTEQLQCGECRIAAAALATLAREPS